MRRPTRHRRPVVSVLAAVPLLVLGACGGETTDDPDALPAEDVTSFAEGGFDDLPRPPRTTPLNERQDRDGATVQSFVVRDETPAGVVEFFTDALSDHEQASPPEQIGDEAYRAEWRVDGQLLRVSARRAPAVEPDAESGDSQTQYSLILYEEGETPPDVDDG